MGHADAPRNGRVPSGKAIANVEQAAQGPAVEAVSAAGVAAPTVAADRPAEALGRQTLSTAFVRVGADRLLTVGLRDGQSIVLRDVTMRATDYCGTQMLSGGGGGTFCGSYADVATARPGAPMTPHAVDPSAEATGGLARPDGRS